MTFPQLLATKERSIAGTKDRARNAPGAHCLLGRGRTGSAASCRADGAETGPYRGPKTAHPDPEHRQVPSQARGRDVLSNTQAILSVVPRNAIPRGIRQGETPGAEGTGMGFRQQMLASTQVRHATPAFAAGLAGTQL